jgi:glycerophosphoryl diester phosphodiesterase
VSAFHLPTIDRVHAQAPHLATGWLLINVPDTDAVLEQTVRHGHSALHPHHAFIDAALVAAAHAAGLAVNTWTVDDPDRIRWLADLGVDSAIANDPAAALVALGRRPRR